VNELFRFLDLETISSCNRTCPTCIRNSHPDKKAISSWFEVNYLPLEVITEALDQCVALGFTGGVCLSHYNEPLMDERIAEIAALAKSYGQFSEVFMNSNGDFLTEELAKDLDGHLDKIIVSLESGMDKNSIPIHSP
jgi:molybdenum cofactor biosynthesis enzyme MoaA